MCVWHEVVAVNVTADGVRIQGKPRGKIACFSLKTALRGRPRNGIYVSVISKNFFTRPSNSRRETSTVSVPRVHFLRSSSCCRYGRPPRVRDQFISSSPSQLASVLYINCVPRIPATHSPAQSSYRSNDTAIKCRSHSLGSYLFPSKNIFYHLYIIVVYSV